MEDALKKANLFIGVSAPGIISLKALRRMASQPIVFALANPTPEIMPEEALQKAYIVATGRSDYPNQINNVLAFPGIFRGALNVRARRITEVLIACNFPKDGLPSVAQARRARGGGWWARQESNLHPFRDGILSPARLPIPPLAHCDYVVSGFEFRVSSSIQW